MRNKGLIKKITGALLLPAVMLSLTACGGGAAGAGESAPAGEQASSQSGDAAAGAASGTETAGAAGGSYAPAGEAYWFANEGYDSVPIGQPEKPLDPEAVYDKLTYIPEMFYGSHVLTGGEAAEEAYVAEMDYMEITEVHSGFAEGTQECTAIPCAFCAGPETLTDPIGKVEGYNWAQVEFRDRDGNIVLPYAAYEVDGSTLKLQLVTGYKLKDGGEEIETFELDEQVLEYEFRFRGLDLTLSRDGKSVTMRTGYIRGDEETPTLIVDSYAAPGDPTIDSIGKINYYWKEDYKRVYFVRMDEEGNSVSGSEDSAVLSGDGLLTFAIPFEDGTKTYQFVYFQMWEDGLILTDGKNIYKYMLPWNRYTHYGLDDVVAEEAVVDELTESRAEELIETKRDILGELRDSFAEKEVEADVSEVTGRVTLDASFLFGTDSAELSEEGKAYLENFTAAYADVILEEAGEGAVAQILVEGHTDTAGTHEYNQELSEKRAQSVVDCCLAQEPGLEQFIQAKGCSFDDPVYDENGEVDMAASRRVVFRFILNP